MKTSVWTVLFVFAASASVSANPTFSHTEAGDIRIDEQGPVYNIYSADRSIGAFQSFGNVVGETINSIQPSADNSVIFKVIGTQPSEFFGALNANSHVFLVNPNGILFGPGSQVNAPGLVASALELKTADFDARAFQFEKGLIGSGYVLNEGALRSSEGGYVALLGTTVENRGTIETPLGTTALAAGGAATVGLDADGGISLTVTKPIEGATLFHSGLISATGGLVYLSAQAMDSVFDQVLNLTGVVEANSVEERGGKIILNGGDEGVVLVSGRLEAQGDDAGEDGGEVRITGQYVGLFDGAKLDASGDAGGGTVLVGGDYKGQNPDIPNAAAVFFEQDAVIRADALSSGDGGKVILWSDNATRAYGTISAIGSSRGIGGFVETSGKNYLSVEGARVIAGEWLLDPLNVTVSSSSSVSGSFGGGNPDIWTPLTTGSNILNTDINASLNAGTSVTINTTAGGAEPGNITVSSGITKSAGGAATLTLNATTDIIVTAPITSTSGALNVILNATNGNITLSEVADILSLISGNATLQAPLGSVNILDDAGDGNFTEIKTTGSVTLDTRGVATSSVQALSLRDVSSLTITDRNGSGVDMWIEELNAATILSTDITVATIISGNIDIDYFGADVVDINQGHILNNVSLARSLGNFTYTATTGNVTLETVTAAGSVHLTSTAGSINEGTADATSDITTPDLYLTAAQGIGGGSKLDVDVTTLSSATVTGVAGGISINDLAGGMTVVSATTPAGLLTFKATGGNLTITDAQMTGGVNNATLDTVTSGNILIGNLVSTAGVTMTSAGSIEESGSDGGTDIKTGAASALTLSSVSGIGGSGQIEIEAGTLFGATVSGTGGINLKDMVGGLNVSTAAVTTADGDITLAAVGGDLTLSSSVTAGGPGHNISLSTTTSGNVVISDVTAAGDNVTINSVGAIQEQGAGDGPADLTAQSASLTAATGIYGISPGDPLETDLDTLTLAQVTSTGAINLKDMAGGINMLSVITNDGPITLSSAAALQVMSAISDQGVVGVQDILLTNTIGPMSIGVIQSDDIASFTATAGSIFDANGPALNVTAATAIFDTTPGFNVGTSNNFIEVNVATAVNTTGVTLPDVAFICAGTECDILPPPPPGSGAGLVLTGNHVTGGDNYQQFLAASTTTTDSGAEPGAETEEEKEQEGDAPAYVTPGAALPPPPLVVPPPTFQQEAPVEPATFNPCPA